MKIIKFCLPLLFLAISRFCAAGILTAPQLGACLEQDPDAVILESRIYPRIQDLLTVSAQNVVRNHILQLEKDNDACVDFLKVVVPYMQQIVAKLDGIEALGKD